MNLTAETFAGRNRALTTLLLVGFALNQGLSFDRDAARIGTWYWSSSTFPLKSAQAVEARGSTVYLAYLREGLVVLDASDPSRPTLITRFEPTSFVTSFKIHGDYGLLVDWNGGIQIYDLSQSSSPRRVGSYDPGNSVWDAAVSGDRMYAFDHETGVTILSITNVAEPQPLGYYRNVSGRTLAASGELVFVGTFSAGLLILDASDPTTPTLVGSLAIENPYQFEVSDQHLFSSGIRGLQIVDVSEPTNPILVGAYLTQSARGLSISNHLAFLADYDAGVIILDVSDPANPHRVGGYKTLGHSQDVVPFQGYLFIADDWAGLQIVQADQVANPQRLGQFETRGYFYNRVVATVDDHAYLVDQVGALQVFDIQNPVSPLAVGTVGLQTYARAIVTAGSHCYVAEDLRGVEILDLTDAAHPRVIGTYVTNAAAADVTVAGGRLFVASSSRGLDIVDVTSPAEPRLLENVKTDLPARVVAVAGNYAYVGLQMNVLEIIDITPTATPSKVGRYALGGTSPFDGIRSIALNDNYVLLGLSSEVVLLIDVTDPARPFAAGMFPISGQPLTMKFSGAHLLIASEYGGLDVIESRTWRRVGGNRAFAATDLAISGDKLCVSAGLDGLAVLNLFTPHDWPPVELHPLSRMNERGVDLSLTALPGLEIQIDRSTDLLDWQPWRNLTVTNSAAQILRPDFLSTEREFYRARLK